MVRRVPTVTLPRRVFASQVRKARNNVFLLKNRNEGVGGR